MAIIFDLDDTLLDHTAAVLAGATALYEHVGPSLSRSEFLALWTASLKRQFDRYLAGELSYEGQRRERAREVVDSTLSDSAADRVFSVYLRAYEDSWALYPDVELTLNQLSGRRLGIITNGQVHQQRLKLERTGLEKRFEWVLISEECGFAKPDPKIFWTACSLLESTPSRSVYVGDSYDVDAAAARRAGLLGIWLDRTDAVRADHEPPVVSSLAEVPRLVTELEA